MADGYAQDDEARRSAGPRWSEQGGVGPPERLGLTWLEIPFVPGAEVWVDILAVGQPTPTDPAPFTFVALDTRTPYTLDFAGTNGGEDVNCLLRWVNPTGEKGPWRETATATIGA